MGGLVSFRRACGAAAVMLLAFAAPALADSATISVKDTAGQEDPAADLPRTFTVSGNSPTQKRVYIKYRNPGGAPCAPTAASDSGTWFLRAYSDDWDNERRVNGDFSFSDVVTWQSPGTFVFCIWLATADDASAAAIAQTITFRGPGGTISGSVAPLRPAPYEQFTITIAGASESPKQVYATFRSAGAPCAQSFSADSGESLFYDRQHVNGNFAIPVTRTVEQSGSYVVCMWLASSEQDAAPVAGPQALTFDVGFGPPQLAEKSAACIAAEARGRRLRMDMRRNRQRLKRARTKRARRNYARRYRLAKRKLNRTRATIRRECP